MKTVYIASPYSKGNAEANVNKQIRAFAALAKLGFAPMAPLLGHFVHRLHPIPYEAWMAMDLEWIPRCDILLRLPGESAGADREVECALQHGVPVFFAVEDIQKAYNISGRK